MRRREKRNNEKSRNQCYWEMMRTRINQKFSFNKFYHLSLWGIIIKRKVLFLSDRLRLFLLQIRIKSSTLISIIFIMISMSSIMTFIVRALNTVRLLNRLKLLIQVSIQRVQLMCMLIMMSPYCLMQENWKNKCFTTTQFQRNLWKSS